MIRARMDDIRAKGRLRTIRAVHRISPRECEIDGRRLLDFSSNDYMGLSMRPELIDGAVEWSRRYGTGSGAQLPMPAVELRAVAAPKDGTFRLSESLLDKLFQ